MPSTGSSSSRQVFSVVGQDLPPDLGPAALSDVVLLDRIRAGHTEAWEILIGRYERLVYSVAVRNGLSPEDAMDVTQSTFTILLEAHTNLRSQESLASWLMTVSRRQAWRVGQRARREEVVAELAPAREEPGIDWEQAASVHTALARLGDPCRELLIALYFDPRQPTYMAVARRMGRSIGGIGPLRARCLQRLRTHLGDIEWT